MQVDSPEKLRNVAVAGHNDTGKTTLVSALLYAGGVTTRLHRVEDGNTLTDFDHEETERRISIGLAACFLPWQQHKINLLDCPGYGIFFSETQQGLRAADSAILCVNGVAGVEVNTEKVWKAAAWPFLPRFTTASSTVCRARRCCRKSTILSRSRPRAVCTPRGTAKKRKFRRCSILPRPLWRQGWAIRCAP